jgi:hypothetical protein
MYYCYECSVLGILFHCAVLCVILCCDEQMRNYLTNYHTPTCFDTIVSSCSVYCLCACKVLLPPDANAIAVNKFIIYHISVLLRMRNVSGRKVVEKIKTQICHR